MRTGPVVSGARRAAIHALWLIVALAVLPAQAALRGDIGQALAQEGITGAVWATLEDGAVQANAAGAAARGVPMQPGHRVQVGSIAKLVLATGVLKLVTEGRLSLDAPVTGLLPDVALDNRWAASDPVRLRHLLDHTAGLDDLRLSQFFSLEATAHMPLAQATDIGRPLAIRSRPGTRFSYSNTGYALLGRIIERTTGMPYERYLDNAVLAPLGMHDSTFRFVTQAGPRADPRLAMGHFERHAPQPAVAIALRPAAQFTTTAPDMVRFATFLMGDGRVDGARFIDPDLMRARGRATGTEAARAGLRVGYALGLGLVDRHGATGLCHGGDTVGFRAMLCTFPEQGRAYFIAFNADVEGADYARIRGMLVDALRVAKSPTPASGAPAPDVHAWAGLYVPAPNRFATFRYVDTLFGAVRLQFDGTHLRLLPVQRASVTLASVGGRLYRAPDRVLASHVLLVGDDGARVLANDRQSYERIAGWKLGLLWASLAAGMLGLLYVLVAGTWRALRRTPWSADALRLPWLGVLALFVPVPLFLGQSFLRMADVTAASVALAGATMLLPVALVVGLARVAVRRHVGSARLDAIALLAALQWIAVLSAWGLMPLRTWHL